MRPRSTDDTSARSTLNMIRIWKFADAPPDLKGLYPFGSSETWVLEATPDDAGNAGQLMLSANSKSREVSRFELADGRLVFFGSLL